MNFIEHIISHIAPHSCLGCKIESNLLLCESCVQDLPPVPDVCYRCNTPVAIGIICSACAKTTGLDAVYVCTPYENVAKQLVWKLKFDRGRAAAKDIAAACHWRLPVGTEVDSVTYVPTANRRVRQRGYDQAELITRHYAELTTLPVAASLARLNHERQVGASAQDRREHMRHAFYISRPEMIKDRRILLIDDVITTGSSIEAAAKALLAAGATSVIALTFARAPHPI